MPYRQPTDAWTIEALLRLGERIRSWRRQVGLSQRGLGRIAGVDQAAISRLEHGLAPGLRASAIARLVRAIDDHRPFG